MHRPLSPRRRSRLRLPQPLRALGWAVLGLVLLPYALTPLYSVMQPVSTLMIWRRIVGERVERTYVPMARISNTLKLAVLIAEDGRFTPLASAVANGNDELAALLRAHGG